MKSCIIILNLLAVCASGVCSLSAKADAAKVEVVGVSIGKKLSSDAANELFMFKADGTKLYTLITLPGKTIIGADREASKFGKFTDDKGTNLFAPLGHVPEADDWIGTFGPKLTEDGKACGLTVEAPARPVPGATKLLFNANMVFRCGTSIKTVEQKNVALKKGSKITIGPVPMEIVQTQVAANETSLGLKSRASLERILSVRFFNAAGKEIESRIEGYESSSIFGNYEITRTYKLPGKVPVANVKIAFYDKVETVSVPLAIEAGLGL